MEILAFKVWYDISMDKLNFKNLTQRELEVLSLLVQGKTNGEIADRLFISKHTVKAHLESIYDKLSLHNKVQVAVYSIMNGLVEIEYDCTEAN